MNENLLIENKSELVQDMAWHQTGVKSFPKPMVTKINDAIWYRKGSQWINQMACYLTHVI